MNYKIHYEELINTRKDRALEKDVYYERHHIIPKCLGGLDMEENLVPLTSREHYIAHWLLCKMHPTSWKLKNALFQMAICNNRNRRVISETQFKRAKKYMSMCLKYRYTINDVINPGKSDKSRTIAKSRFNSNKNPMSMYPEKNHTAKSIFVEYSDGGVKHFKMKKELAKEIKELTSLCDSAIKTRIIKNNLQEYGYKNIVMEDKENKPAKACIGRKWFTNGTVNEFIFPGSETIGFFRGVTRRATAKLETLD